MVCGAADAREIAGPEDIRAEAEFLWEFHMRRLSPRTPPGRLVDRVAFSQEPPWRLVRCDTCGLVYRNPVERREAVRVAYESDEPDRATLMALHQSQRRFYRSRQRRLSKRLEGKGTGLEVGSYVGAFLAAAREARWQFEGLDVSARINDFARSLGFVVHDGDLEHFHPDRMFNAIAIWNTFDQLPDPKAALRAVRRLLTPGGVLAIRVPNGECYTRMRPWLEADAVGRKAIAHAVLAHNNLLTFPYRFGFSPNALRRLLEELGFVVDEVVGDVLVPTADEWTKPWARIEERIVKPLTRRWTPWFEVYAWRRHRAPP